MSTREADAAIQAIQNEIISLLRSKNRCLQQFLDLSASFWEEVDSGCFENVTSFETRRESMLKAIDLFDRKISEQVTLLPVDDRQAPELVETVKRALHDKEILIHRILSLDLRILKKIDEERERLMRELTSTNKQKDTLSKFKSSWVSASGEELDQKL